MKTCRFPSALFVGLAAASAFGGHTKNIMLTGYWPPTGQMLARFSTDTTLNPGGWMGLDWEHRGYNVYAYYPQVGSGQSEGTGDFAVDYQRTLADFNRITAQLHPVAILSYGQIAGSATPVVLEPNSVNWTSWIDDYEAPYQPTPSPPDGTVPAGYVRHSTLPLQSIASAINSAGIGPNFTATINSSGDPGYFLCNYLAYQDEWYQSRNGDPSASYQCLAAGFTHVADYVTLSQATAVSDIELRTTIAYLDTLLVPEPSTFAIGLAALGGLAFCLWRKRRSGLT
jgi:pyrrolidone-carboxylate peptidase